MLGKTHSPLVFRFVSLAVYAALLLLFEELVSSVQEKRETDNKEKKATPLNALRPSSRSDKWLSAEPGYASRTLALRRSPWTLGDLVCHQFCTKWGYIFQLRGILREEGDRDEHLGMSTLKYHLEGEGLSQFNSGQNVMVMIWVRWRLKQSRILEQQMSRWQL